MKTTAGYIRVSTEKQTEGYGLEAQEQAIREFAKARQFQNLEIYAERGVSGALENRPELGRLIVDIDADAISRVIIVRLDRLARDILVQENLIADLARKGVELISIEEPDLAGNDPTRKMFRQIKGVINEYEKDMIKLRMRTGRVTKARQGGFVGGRRPIGYERAAEFAGKRRPDLQIDVEAADTVKLIFRLKRRRWTLAKIARHLNDNGIATARGGRWHRSTVRYILKNPIYKGEIGYNGLSAMRSDLQIQ